MTYTFNSTENTANNNKTFNLDLSKYDKPIEKKGDYITDILNKMKNIFPWTKDKDDTITIDIIPMDFTYGNITAEALNLEWNKAATRLHDYIYYSEHPSYDFKIGDIPVKIHGNYIQVGSRIIPNFTTSGFFNKLTKKERIKLYQISLTINEIEIAA